MLQQYTYPSTTQLHEIIARPSVDFSDIQQRVAPIMEAVQYNGDTALSQYSLQFDKVEISSFIVTKQEIEEAIALVPPALQAAIAHAAQNIHKFHSRQQQDLLPEETTAGVFCWRKNIAIETVGLYIPGGTAPLFSTVMMLSIPAKIAGCKRIILCTPPNSEGKIHPAILYAAQHCGVHEIYKVGGAQAIAAMAYGTTQIAKVNKIFGPGNQYVTAAKMIVAQQGVAIDMPAGPSEVCVIADAGANPEYVAIDLLSQAEHGADSHVLCITDTATQVDAIQNALQKLLELLPRNEYAQKALINSKIVLVNNIEEAISLSNKYAPEHLILSVNDAEQYIPLISNAGSVFLGYYTPESAGDYASGTNHTLPTSGYASTYSGVSLDSFVKKVTFQKITKEGLQNLGNTIITMAEAESLQAHALAVKIRLQDN